MSTVTKIQGKTIFRPILRQPTVSNDAQGYPVVTFQYSNGFGSVAVSMYQLLNSKTPNAASIAANTVANFFANKVRANPASTPRDGDIRTLGDSTEIRAAGAWARVYPPLFLG